MALLLAARNQLMREAYHETYFTPDMVTLEKYQFQLLFIYDRMMHNYPEHMLIEEHGVQLPTAFSLPEFSLWKHELGLESYPVAIRTRHKEILCPTARVKGELYAMRPYQFLELDKHRLNGVEFIRERVQLVVPYHSARNPGIQCLQGIKAWMYVGNPDYWNDQLDGGFSFRPATLLEAHNQYLKKYYFFHKEKKNK
jgi:Gamma-glutamyl cyclotransferase, AIG2-like